MTTPPRKGIVCPNHGCPLEGIPFPTPQKGEGVCPVSGAHFAFAAEIDDHTLTKDLRGNLIKGSKWNLTGNE